MLHYNLAIIDDNTASCEQLSTHLNTYARLAGVSFTFKIFNQATEFLDAVMKEAFVLCIVSMDMPACNICSFSDQLYRLKLSIPMILTSQDTDRAYEAFRNEASGFLLTPVCYEDLSELLNRLLPYLFAKMSVPNTTNSIMVRQDGNPFYILTRDIYYFEKYRNKLYIYTKNSCYHIYDTIRSLRHQLNPKQFVQIHQGCLVNWNHVDHIARETIYAGPYKLSISRTYYKAVLFQFKMHPLENSLPSYVPQPKVMQVAQPDVAILSKKQTSPVQSLPDLPVKDED